MAVGGALASSLGQRYQILDQPDAVFSFWRLCTLFGKKIQSLSANVNHYKRNVVGRRPVAPSSYAIEDGLFQFMSGQGGRLTDDFLNAWNAQHFSSGIKRFGNPVGIND